MFSPVRRVIVGSLGALVGSIALAACSGTGRHESNGYEVIARYSHDTTAFTEGLLWADSVLYESTGLYGHSEIRRVDLRSGRVLAARALSPTRFGEGLALLDGHLYQLTWKSGVGYIYDVATLAPTDSFTFPGEGWGLTTDGAALIMSNGTDSLRFLDPKTFATVREIEVRDKGLPLSALNELEYVHGELYANVYQSNWIVKINPMTGDVLQWFDLSALVPHPNQMSPDKVLNGIAFDPKTGDLLVTGKMWPVLYEIRTGATSVR